MVSVSRIRWLLGFVAVAGLGSYVYFTVDAWLYQTFASEAFTRMLEARALSSAPSVASAGEWQGRLEIPRIDMATMILRGTNGWNLSHGVAHIEGTALPGTSGNAGLAAHRDTFFRRLGELEMGDTLVVRTLDGVYEYDVQRIRIVDTSAIDVLRDIGTPALTLVTCYPFDYIGPAPKRYVITAVMRQSAVSH